MNDILIVEKTKNRLLYPAFEPTSEINGTSGQGNIGVPYSRLVEIFGEPHNEGDGHKTDAERALKFSDGTIATIYNWKNGRNYEGRNGLDVEDITDWNIGGNSNKAVRRVMEQLGLA